MDWEQALRRRCLGDAGVAALVGTRVYWRVRPQGSALPALVLTLISDPRPQTLKAFQERRFSRVQVDCWADGGEPSAPETRAQVVALREAAIAALAGPFTQDGIGFGRSDFTPVTDRGESTETGVVHRDQFDVLVFHD